MRFPHTSKKHKPIMWLVKLCRKKFCSKLPSAKVLEGKCRSRPTCELESPNLLDYIDSNHLKNHCCPAWFFGGRFRRVRRVRLPQGMPLQAVAWPSETVREVLLKLFVELLQVAWRKKHQHLYMYIYWWDDGIFAPCIWQWREATHEQFRPPIAWSLSHQNKV